MYFIMCCIFYLNNRNQTLWYTRVRFLTESTMAHLIRILHKAQTQTAVGTQVQQPIIAFLSV